MKRWLKIARAEMLRDIRTALRYPVEVTTGIFIMYVLFMALYIGAKSIAGGQALSGDLDGLVVGYLMWFFSLMAINTMSIDLEREAQQGTLEQVYLHAPNFLGVLWMRAGTHLLLGAGMVLVLNAAIQVSTGNYLELELARWPLVVLAAALALTGLCGIGLMLGGLSLVFKRIGQLSAIVQFSLFFLAYLDLQQVPEGWRGVVSHLPLARGVDVLKGLLAGVGGDELMRGLVWLGVDSTVYALAGCLLFAWLDRVARRSGLLSHY